MKCIRAFGVNYSAALSSLILPEHPGSYEEGPPGTTSSWWSWEERTQHRLGERLGGSGPGATRLHLADVISIGFQEVPELRDGDEKGSDLSREETDASGFGG